MYNREQVVDATLKYFNGNELATNVFVDKYALRSEPDVWVELTPDDMHKRMATEFARIECNYSNDRTFVENFNIFYNEMKDFARIVPQGSPMAGIGNEYSLTSISNCKVVESPQDSIEGIMTTAMELAILYSLRAGVGVDISTLRPENARVNNAAMTSTGAWSFADFFSYITRMIATKGRRGALMVSLDIRHPDVRQFIKMKADLGKVTGANVSLHITDDFMEAVEADSDFTLQWPVDSTTPVVTEVVKAREIFDMLSEYACNYAEPGCQFWDTVLNYSLYCVYEVHRAVTSNPCGEQNIPPEDSCRLISENLTQFVKHPFTDQAQFDIEQFYRSTRIATRMADNMVDIEIGRLQTIVESTTHQSKKDLLKRFINKAKAGRRVGLGTHGLADTLLMLGLKYGSNESLRQIKEIFFTFKNAAFDESVQLAKERGCFEDFDWQLEKDHPYTQRLNCRVDMAKYGRRNVALLTQAPTGSTSIISLLNGQYRLFSVSSGLEPNWKFSHTRRRKVYVEESNKEAVVFTDASGDQWEEYDVFASSVELYRKLNPNAGETLPEYFVDSSEVVWQDRVKLQGLIQKYIDNAISSTINLPKDTKPEVVRSIYRMAHKEGLKGVTVYVDGSRDGVLISKEDTPKTTGIVYNDAPIRPEVLDCDIQRSSVKGDPWLFLVGTYDGKPYEVIGGPDTLSIPGKVEYGLLVKEKFKTKRNKYTFYTDINDGAVVSVDDIVSKLDNELYGMVTRMVSTQLRHGVRPRFIVEQLQKDKSPELTSFNRVLARVLKRYIKDGEQVSSSEVCPSCSEGGLVYQEGCQTCLSCGWSKCG